MRKLAFLIAVLAFAIPTAAQASTRTTLACGGGLTVSWDVRPSDCFLKRDPSNPEYGLDLAHSTNLHRVHWSSWGGTSAYGTARVRTKAYDPWTYVRVRAYKPVGCPGGYLAGAPTPHMYTRVRVATSGWSHVWHTPGCIGE